MSTPTSSTPAETPAAIAREIATLATAPVRDFVDCISDEDNTRDHLYQRLVARLTANEPGAWSRAKEDDVDERLNAALATDEARGLFGQLSDHYGTKLAIGESAAFLLGVEVGRQVAPPPDDGLTSEQRATLARGDVLARFTEVERFLDFMSSFALIAAQSHSELPINSAGMDHLSTAAGEAGLTLRKLRQEFEAADGGAA